MRHPILFPARRPPVDSWRHAVLDAASPCPADDRTPGRTRAQSGRQPVTLNPDAQGLAVRLAANTWVRKPAPSLPSVMPTGNFTSSRLRSGLPIHRTKWQGSWRRERQRPPWRWSTGSTRNWCTAGFDSTGRKSRVPVHGSLFRPREYSHRRARTSRRDRCAQAHRDGAAGMHRGADVVHREAAAHCPPGSR